MCPRFAQTEQKYDLRWKTRGRSEQDDGNPLEYPFEFAAYNPASDVLGGGREGCWQTDSSGLSFFSNVIKPCRHTGQGFCSHVAIIPDRNDKQKRFSAWN